MSLLLFGWYRRTSYCLALLFGLEILSEIFTLFDLFVLDHLCPELKFILDHNKFWSVKVLSFRSFGIDERNSTFVESVLWQEMVLNFFSINNLRNLEVVLLNKNSSDFMDCFIKISYEFIFKRVLKELIDICVLFSSFIEQFLNGVL